MALDPQERAVPRTPRRKGAVPRPLHPAGAVVASVLPMDPLGLGRSTFPFRRPRTRLVLEGEFGLRRRQAHAVAVRIASHAPVRSLRLRAMARFWGGVALALLILGVLIGPISWAAYLDLAAGTSESDPLVRLITAGLALTLALAGPGLWLIAERWIMDGLVARELRRCWNDQECIWCGRDMTGCTVDRERWSRCPECGLRSPIGARASTI